MARIDVNPISDELLKKLDEQVEKLGLKNRSAYIRLIIELDSASGLIETLRGKTNEK